MNSDYLHSKNASTKTDPFWKGTEFLLGFIVGVTICLIMALGFCIQIIVTQDALIHNLLLRFSK